MNEKEFREKFPEACEFLDFLKASPPSPQPTEPVLPHSIQNDINQLRAKYAGSYSNHGKAARRLCWFVERQSAELERLKALMASYDRQDELLGTEFEGVDEVTDVIRLLKQERDRLQHLAASQAEALKAADQLAKRHWQGLAWSKLSTKYKNIRRAAALRAGMTGKEDLKL